MAISDYVKKYPGKTIEEIVKLENEAAEQRLQADKTKEKALEDLYIYIRAQKYFKVDHNGSSQSFVEIIKADRHNGVTCTAVNTVIESTGTYIKIENNRTLNILWFQGQGATVTEITKDQYDQANEMLSEIKEKLNSIR